MKRTALAFLGLCLVITTWVACSKNDAPADPCAGVNIAVTGTVTNATTGQSNGSITVTASGGSGFSFSLNGGGFQNSGSFGNLAAGNYTVVARNSNNCQGSAQFTVGTSAGTNNCSGTAGPLFTAVKAIITANCATSGCHVPGGTGPVNFQVDCNIVNSGARIKARAVDGAGTNTQMPPPPTPAISTGQRDAINAWLAAGGRFDN